MKREDAEEFTQSLGQIVGGSWRQIALAKRLGVPAALGLSTDAWVNQRLGGYVKMTVDDRRRAVAELAEEGKSAREIGECVGVSHTQVGRDMAGTNVPPLDAVAGLAMAHHAHRLEEKNGARQAIAAGSAMAHWCQVPDLDRFADGDIKCGTVYADPAWQYGNQATRGATEDHYVGMSVDDICALPVARCVAPNAHLHLWTTNAFLFDAKRVIEAWGFQYRSCFVWVKPQIGMGNYWRVSHEFLLFGIRGSAPFADRSLRSWAELPRRNHSEKPEEVRGLIERSSPGPRLELFARRKAPGWYAWGNAIERSVFDAAMDAV